MSRKKRTKGNLNPTLIVIAALAVVTAGGIGYAIFQQFSGEGAELRDTETAFSVPDLVGQPAPEFTATGADGQPYTFTPGDGRPKAIVFYMGYA